MAGNLVQGALFTLMVVRAESLRDPAFEHELAEQVRRSPRFFLNAPVVLDLRGAAEFLQGADYLAARQALGGYGLRLVGVQNATPQQVEAAAETGLASFAPNAAQPSRRPPPEATASPPAAGRTLLVTQPVRSGTQI
jgi:septum site-determining protein MinC